MSHGAEVALMTGALCEAGGALSLPELFRRCRSSIPEQKFIFVLENCPRFALVPWPADRAPEDCVVVARTVLRICPRYLTDRCTGCQHLHMCRYYVYGHCKFSPGTKKCRFSHDVHSAHNSALLRECTLHELNQDQLFTLLLQNDRTLLPEVCSHYNKGPQLHGICSFRDDCTKLHLCQHHLQGQCVFGRRCKRHHTVNEAGQSMLEERGFSTALIHKLPSILQNGHRLRRASPEEAPGVAQSDKLCSGDICLHFLRNSCRFQESCELEHFHLPYRWQIFKDGSWTDLQQMENIEEAFCDPSNSHSFEPEPVDFRSMTRGSRPVRRLSTVSSVKRPEHYTLTTQWLWFYQQERGTWLQYGEPDDKNRTTSVTSRDLEEAHLANKNEVTLVKGHRQYVLSLTDMYQRNPKHNTKRRVVRRPRYVSPQDVRRLVATSHSYITLLHHTLTSLREESTPGSS